MASAASFNSFTFKLQTREREWSRRFLRLTLIQVLGFLVCFLLASFRFVMRDGKVIHVSKLSDSGPWSVWQVLQLLLYPIPLLLSLSWPALASPFSSVLAALLVLPPLTAPKTGQLSTKSHYVYILLPCTISILTSYEHHAGHPGQVHPEGGTVDVDLEGRGKKSEPRDGILDRSIN